VGRVEGLSVVNLEMGREGQHKEAVYGCDGQAGMFSFAFAGTAEGAKPFYGGGRGPHVPIHIDSEPQVAQ